MSKQNLALVRRTAESVRQKDLEGFLALMAEDVRVQFELGEGERGHDGIRRWWKRVIEDMTELDTEVVEVRESADGLTLTTVRVRGRGAVGGMPFDQTYRVPARWRDGKCVWWGVFLSEQEALQAARQSE